MNVVVYISQRYDLAVVKKHHSAIPSLGHKVYLEDKLPPQTVTSICWFPPRDMVSSILKALNSSSEFVIDVIVLLE